MRVNLLLLLSVFAGLCPAATMDLSGDWEVALDRENQGVEQTWFASKLKDARPVRLPGSLQEQGLGDKPSAKTAWTTRIGKELLSDPRFQSYIQSEDFKSPFWLTPLRHYVGAAWYQRMITLPNKAHSIFLERPHGKTTVWVDDMKLGSCDSLGTPHKYDIRGIQPGQHRLTICVDNRVGVPVGDDAHSVSDQTQSNWNGIVGRIEVTTCEDNDPWVFDDVQVYPDIQANTITVRVDMENAQGLREGKLTASVQAIGTDIQQILPEQIIPVRLKDKQTRVEFTYAMGKEVRLWDEFSPSLYRLRLAFEQSQRQGEPSRSLYQTTFGMRELGVKGTQFTINGRTLFLRGTLECCIFPLTGYPPTDVESWKKILRVCKAYGLNHIRFHSWCPPEAAFAAADAMGFYYQVEASCWATFGEGTAVDGWIYQEGDRMLKAYGNHPSFILMAPSNEPHGRQRDAFLAKLIDSWEKKDSRRRYTAGSGWPTIEANDYHVVQDVRVQRYPTLRLSDTPQTFTDYRDFIARHQVPVISHEIGQWCAYPNFAERWKYSGVLKGGNIEIARDRLEKAGMGSLGQDFLMASGKFQTLLYKHEIESALRTPGFGGFQLLDLHDFPGQGTAPVGVLDCFWESKGYVTPEQYHRFCGPTVPLARMKSRVFTHDQTFKTTVDVAHYGASDITVEPVWFVRRANGQVVSTGKLETKRVPTGGLTSLGEIEIPLTMFRTAQKLTLEVALGTPSPSNDWDFWVYPASVPAVDTSEVRIAEQLDDPTVECLKQGGKVLLTPPANRLKARTLGTFRPIFWNRITFASQPEHTLGILCDPAHPALAEFPTDFYSNWQWQDLLDHSKPVVLDELDSSITPIVRLIDDWNLCRRLAVLFEVQVGKGRLLLCSMDIHNDLDRRPVARQLRYSLLRYMESEAFKPAVSVSIEAIQGLFQKPSAMQSLQAKVVFTDSQERGYEGSKAIDGDPATMWHTAWTADKTPYPHEIRIELAQDIEIYGFSCLLRQDGNRNGRVAEYACYVSPDGKNWGTPAAEGILKEEPVRFGKPVKGRFFRFVALKGYNNDPFASVAELDLIIE
ncbi:discoidin domain-containing protein [Anaerohalosphaeraceae bacterium U12dextr]